MWLRCLKSVWAVLVIAGIGGWLISCDDPNNPFSPNLGKKVDIEYPKTYVLDPLPGKFLKDTITFSGRATAYRELAKVEVTVLDPEDSTKTLYPWTPVALSGSDKKEKNWLYTLETTDLDDGWLRIKFRAIDETGLTEANSVELMYIIKNGPSKITMANPDEKDLYKFNGDEKVSLVENPGSLEPSGSGSIYQTSKIQGTIIDRRGIKPGYPRIKIWPATLATEPPDNDPQWGWVVLFLREVDDVALWEYGTEDLSARPVENNLNFEFKLAEFNRVVDPKDNTRYIVQYKRVNGEFVPFALGEWRFRIMTRDSFFYETLGAENYLWPLPGEQEGEIVTYEPPLKENGTPEYNVKYHTIEVIPVSDEVTQIKLDNGDTGKTYAELKESEPNIYIYTDMADKITVAPVERPAGYDPDDPDKRFADFRLRIMAFHTNGVKSAVLKWSHPEKGAGFLPWDDLPGGGGYVNNTDDDTRAEFGHNGSPNTMGITGSRIFQFTGINGKTFLYYPNWDGDPDKSKGTSATGPVFTSNPKEYTFTVTTYNLVNQSDPDPAKQTYFLTLSDGGPEIIIRDIKGWSVNRASSNAGVPEKGGTIYTDAYTVNDNIEVEAIVSTNLGIREDDGKKVVKWFLEDVNPASSSTPDPTANNLLKDLREFRSKPTAAEVQAFLTYLKNDAATRPSGTAAVSRRGSVEGDSFKLSVDTRTVNANGDKTGTNTMNNRSYWLYVVAQDGLSNLGYTVQKLTVDDDGDRPVMELSGLYHTADTSIPAPDRITSVANLYIGLDANNVPTKDKTNVLMSSTQGIGLTLKDDDGIRPSAVTIQLTSVNLNRTVTITGDKMEQNGKAIGAAAADKNWNGVVLTQAVMAQALYPSASPALTALPDGVYTVVINVPDDPNSKVQIGTTQRATLRQSYTVHFAVHTALPQIEFTLTSASGAVIADNLLPPGNINIRGTVKSRLQIQKMEISFTPNILNPSSTDPGIEPLTLYANTNYNTTNITADVNGDYTYYWRKDNVDFNPAGLSAGTDSRDFTVRAWDRLAELNSAGRTVEADDTPPIVEMNTFNFGRVDYDGKNDGKVNGKVPFEVEVSDANGIGTRGDFTETSTGLGANDAERSQPAIRWIILPDNSSLVPSWTLADSAISNVGGRSGWIRATDRWQADGRYRIIINTLISPAMTERRFSFYVIAKDKAGNNFMPPTPPASPTPISPRTPLISFTVDQSSDTPKLDELSPLNGTVVGGTNAVLKITGTLYDDDGFNTTRAAATTNTYVQIQFPGSSAWTDIPGTINNITGNLKFDYDYSAVANDHYLFGDGVKQFRLRIRDEVTRGPVDPQKSGAYIPEGKNPDNSNTITETVVTLPSATTWYTFTLKNTNPEIFFNQYDPNLCHLAGHAFNAAHNHAYHATTNPTGLTDVRPTFRTQAELLAALNNKVTITPAPNPDYRGTIRDISIQSASFTYGNSTPQTLTLGGTGDTRTWSVTNTWLNAFGSAADGMYSVTVLATDTLGNSSTVEWTFYKDTTGPAISFDNIHLTNLRTISGSPGDVYVTGQFNDIYTDIGPAFDYRFDSLTWVNNFNIVDNKGTIDGNFAAWSAPIPAGTFDGSVGSFPDGAHYFSIRARDKLTNETVQGNGTTSVKFIVDREPPNMITKAAGTAVTNRIIIKNGPPGVPTNGYLEANARVFSAANAKNGITPTPPTLPANDTAVVFTLSGMVYEHNLNELRAAIRNGTTAPPTTGSERLRTLSGIYDSPIAWNKGGDVSTSFGNGTVAPNYLTGASFRVRRAATGDFGLIATDVKTNRYVWELDVRVKDFNELLYAGTSPSFMLDDGLLRTITITARDLAPFDSEVETWPFYLDSTAPAISFSNLETTNNIFGEAGAITLKGSVEDQTIVRAIQYRLDTWNYSANPPAWVNGTFTNYTGTGVGSSDRVNFEITNAALANEGQYRITVRAYDYSLGGTGGASGNVSADTVREFYIDRSDPVITWPTTQNFYRWDVNNATGKIVFNLSVTDANTIYNTGATPLTGELRQFGTTTKVGTVAVVAATPDATTSAVTVTITNTGPSAPLANGRYTLVLFIKDKTGREASVNQTFTFYLDNNAPVITIENLNTTNGNSNTVLGTSTEAITGRVEFRGLFTKSSTADSKVSRVAYAVSTGAMPATTRAAFTTTGTGTNNNIQANTRFYTFANHGLVEGDTVVVDGFSRYVLWVNGNNFKLSNNYTKDSPATNVWNPSAATAIMVNYGLDAALRLNNWHFNDGSGASPATLSTGTGANASNLMTIDQGLARATLLLYNTRRFYSTTMIEDEVTAAAGIMFNDTAISSGGVAAYGDNQVRSLRLHLLAADEAGNLSTKTFEYWVYPAGDNPAMTAFTTPEESSTLVNRRLNGTIKIAGGAIDNYRVRQVWFRVLEDGAGTAAAGSIPAGYKVAALQKIPVWNTTTWGEGTGVQTPTELTFRYRTGTNTIATETSGGWYIANRTSDANDTPVSWWAQINKENELDPKGGALSREIRIQTLAEDTIWDDSLNTNNGGYSTTGNLFSVMREVEASVVSGAPIFGLEEVSSTASASATADDWGNILTSAVKGRASYRVTVRHDSGVSAIRWTNNPASSGITPTANVTSTTNLFDIDNTAWTAQIAQVNNTAANTAGVAIKAGPKNPITGNATGLSTTKTYMIWKVYTGTFPPTGIPSTAVNQQFATFSPTAASVNLGDMVIMEQVDGHFEWLVTVDIAADKLGITGGAGYFNMNFEADENSRTVPLFSRKTAAIPIDTLPPTGRYTQTTSVVGTNVTFGGEASDAQAPVMGLNRVVLWFSRNVNLGGNTTGERSIVWNSPSYVGGAFNAGSTVGQDISAMGIIDGKTGNVLVNLPAGVQLPLNVAASATTGNVSSIVIDRADPLGKTEHHGHKLPMDWAATGNVTRWHVSLDSTQIESGRVYAHYIVYDRAGNATYYSQKLMILNNVPKISTITLATDIYGDDSPLNLQSTLNGANAFNLTFAGAGSVATGTSGSAIDRIRARYGNGTVAGITAVEGITATTDAEMGIKKEIPIDTSKRGVYSVVFDEKDFMVRNKLLAVQVNTVNGQSSTDKRRYYRVEYVSNARLIEGVANLTSNSNTNQQTGIRAGRVYIINSPGINNFPWGVLGAQTDTTYQRGMVFLAMQDGSELDATVKSGNYGTGANAPSAWELNSTYYNNNAVHALSRNNVPAALRYNNNVNQGDVVFNGSTDASYAKTAEFVYRANAFGTSGGSAIIDFSANNGNNLDALGRPLGYPASATQSPWLAHSLFIVRVFDGAGTDVNAAEAELFGDFALLSIRVNNNDITPPYAQLYDFNPKTDTMKPAMGGNRTKGGLVNDSVSANGKSGHIEPRAGTSLTGPDMGGASGSGSINYPAAAPTVSNARAYFEVDTVSGDVIVRGYAEDNQRIARVDLQFFAEANTGDPLSTITILQQDTDTTVARLKATTDRNVEFTETVDLDRHRVEWAYRWPTEDIPGAANIVGNFNIRVRAYNANSTVTAGTPNTAITANETVHTSRLITRSAITTANRNTYDSFNLDYPVSGTSATGAGVYYRYNDIRVNLRPYITGFLRNQAQFSHNTRSRQGRYMLARDEEAIVAGFNLRHSKTATTSATNIILPGTGSNRVSIATSSPGTNTAGNYGLTETVTTRHRLFTVSTSAASGTGQVTMTVNGYSAVNTPTPVAAATNETAASLRPMVSSRPVVQPWNKEFSAGKEGSDLWDDYTMVHIWQSNDTNANADQGRFKKGGTAGNPVLIEYPSMSIDPATGTLWESHNEGGGGGNNTGTTKTSNNNDATNAQIVAQFIDPIVDSDIFISSRDSGPTNNLSYTVWTSYSIIGRAGDSSQANAWRDMGGVYLSGPQGSKSITSPGQHSAGAAVAGTTNNGFNTNELAGRSQYIAESTIYNGGYNNPNLTITLPPGSKRAEPLSLNQFRNSHIATYYGNGGSGTSYEHIHVAYYDTMTKSIKYRYNRRNDPGVVYGNGATSGNPAAMNLANIPAYAWTNLDGGWDQEDTRALETNNINNAPFDTIVANRRVVGYGNPTANGFPNNFRNATLTGTTTNDYALRNDTGEHNAIAVTRNGYPVIAYYDVTQQRLKLAVSRAVNPYLASNWTIRDFVIPDGNKLSSGTGQYVSMKIDTRGTNDIVHIAAMNATSKQVVYVRGTLNPTSGTTGNNGLYQSTGGVLTNVTVSAVDTVGSVGAWCKISLDSAGNPWIAYQDETWVGARDGVKVAFLDTATFYKGATGTTFAGEDIDLYGNNITGWEAMHVPTQFRVRNTRLGMENFPTRNVTTTATKFWKGAVGYLSDDYFRIAYYVE